MGQIETIGAKALESINTLEDFCLEQPQVEIETKERFIGSMYCREIFIPKGVMITSRVYKRGYVDIMLSGDITITDTNGTYRLTGINILEGPSGRKRAGLAHEDTRWITVHDMFDIKKNPIEDISFERVDEYKNHIASHSNSSFLEFLSVNNLTAESVREESETEPYQAIESNAFYVSSSDIEGKGVFSSIGVSAGEIIGPMVLDGAKTQLGRYVNHSGYPNTIYNGDNLMAIRAIDTGQELTLCYDMSPRIKS